MDPKNVGAPVPGTLKQTEVTVTTKTQPQTYIPEPVHAPAVHRVQDYPPPMDQISQTRIPVEAKSQDTFVQRTKEKASDLAETAKGQLSHAAETTKESLARAADVTKEKMAYAADVTKEKMAYAADVTKEKMSHAAAATKDSLAQAATATKGYLSQAAEATKEKVAEMKASSHKESHLPGVSVQQQERNVVQGKAVDYSAPQEYLVETDKSKLGEKVMQFGLPAGVKTQTTQVTVETKQPEVTIRPGDTTIRPSDVTRQF
jgi:murein L,D-transpeptidase YcbB/YkuD